MFYCSCACAGVWCFAVTGGKRLEQEEGFPVLECNIHEARPEEELQAARYGCGEDHEKWTP